MARRPRPQDKDQQKWQRHCDIGANVAAAEMHAGEGRHYPIISHHIEKAGENEAFGNGHCRDERQPCRHSDTQPRHRAALPAPPLAQKRQEGQRDKQPLRHAQRVIRAQIGIIRSAGRAGHAEP